MSASCAVRGKGDKERIVPLGQVQRSARPLAAVHKERGNGTYGEETPLPFFFWDDAPASLTRAAGSEHNVFRTLTLSAVATQPHMPAPQVRHTKWCEDRSRTLQEPSWPRPILPTQHFTRTLRLIA